VTACASSRRHRRPGQQLEAAAPGYGLTLVGPRQQPGPRPARAAAAVPPRGVSWAIVFHRAKRAGLAIASSNPLISGAGWSAELAAQGLPLSFQAGACCCLPATAEQGGSACKRLAQRTPAGSLPLELWGFQQQLRRLTPSLPGWAPCAGLFLPRDGQLDPLEAIAGLPQLLGQRAGRNCAPWGRGRAWGASPALTAGGAGEGGETLV